MNKSKGLLNGEGKFKICIRCNSPFPAHLKGKVCSCIVGGLAEEQLKFKNTNKNDKDVSHSDLLDSHLVPDGGRKNLFLEKD